MHPSRYESAEPLSQATLNRTIAAAVDRINEDRKPDQEQFLPVSVHDLRRRFSSRLNDALFPEASIEACLAHQKKDQVAAAYNHARLSAPRQFLMQVWADMLACWLRGATAKEAIVHGMAKIDAAPHDAEGMNLQDEAGVLALHRDASARVFFLPPEPTSTPVSPPVGMRGL